MGCIAVGTNGPKTYHRGASSGVYGLACLGALVYYFQHADSFGSYVLGFFKALLWPAFLVYNLLEYLKI